MTSLLGNGIEVNEKFDLNIPNPSPFQIHFRFSAVTLIFPISYGDNRGYPYHSDEKMEHPVLSRPDDRKQRMKLLNFLKKCMEHHQSTLDNYVIAKKLFLSNWIYFIFI